MEKIRKFFFDTYALFEIIHASPNYLEYKDSKIITTKLNLMELHYRLLNLYGKEIADKAYDKFLGFSIEIPNKVIKVANGFKLKHKKKRISYIDSVGYILSKFHGIKFLTGDKEFENIKNVEFVK